MLEREAEDFALHLLVDKDEAWDEGLATVQEIAAYFAVPADFVAGQGRFDEGVERRTYGGDFIDEVRNADRGRWLVSDHPAWPPIPWANGTEIIGEVRWCGVTF